jgi:DNA polymerase
MATRKPPRKPPAKRAAAERVPAKKSARKRAVPDGSAPEPVDDSLAALRDAAMGCKRCPLWKPATQTVFGEGPARARVLVVGEQPGDQEDLSGHPFVGPSGHLFDRALEELGIDRGRFYVTNAVKHFKFERRGKARLHRSPNPGEQAACRIWLEGELARVRPEVVVCLGAIAARNVFGTKFRLMAQRGTWQALADGTRAFATVHPSFVLRQRDSASRDQAYRGFVGDLALLLDVL